MAGLPRRSVPRKRRRVQMRLLRRLAHQDPPTNCVRLSLRKFGEAAERCPFCWNPPEETWVKLIEATSEISFICMNCGTSYRFSDPCSFGDFVLRAVRTA